MKKTLFLLALAVPLLAQEGFDFKTLDKLGVNAKNKTNITLDSDMIRLAAGFMSKDSGPNSIKPLVDNLKGIYIRSWEFAKEGQYNEADLEPLRAWLKQAKWNRIVESREDNQSSEVYLLRNGGDRLGGVAVVAAEAKEVTIVYISGDLKPEDIAKLSGNMGIPEIHMNQGPKKTDKKKEDDEQQGQ